LRYSVLGNLPHTINVKRHESNDLLADGRNTGGGKKTNGGDRQREHVRLPSSRKIKARRHFRRGEPNLRADYTNSSFS